MVYCGTFLFWMVYCGTYLFWMIYCGTCLFWMVYFGTYLFWMVYWGTYLFWMVYCGRCLFWMVYCGTCLFWMVHCRRWNRCIMRLVNSMSPNHTYLILCLNVRLWFYRWNFATSGIIFSIISTAVAPWAPSQYKDRLIYVWRFPC